MYLYVNGEGGRLVGGRTDVTADSPGAPNEVLVFVSSFGCVQYADLSGVRKGIVVA